jgi:hypothetical protein
MKADMNEQAHLTDEELAAFVDGGLDAVSRQRAELHLVDCDDCRSLITSASRPIAPDAARPRRGWIAVAGLAAAAAIVLVVRPGGVATLDGNRTRDIEAVGRGAVAFAADAPDDGATVRADTLTFRWSPAADGATYQVTLSSEAGEIVWTGRTSATDLTVPDSVWPRLETGRAYYWQVDAVLPTLRSASTEQRRVFVTKP